MSKPQLTTYSKAILLMHRNEYVCNRPRDNELSALEFFKYLLISRPFLQASQLHQVYEFAIFRYSSDDKKFYVSSMKGKFYKNWATQLELTLEEIRTWNQLLNVQYVRLNNYRYKYADEFSAVSKLFMGHIALDLYNDIDEAENHSDQFKQVLTKHQIKELIVPWMYPECFDPTIDDNFFDDFPTCPSVKKLKFTWMDLDEMPNLLPKVTKMMPFFPNLRQLYCRFEAYYYPYEELSLQKLVVWIRDECRKIEELQKASLSINDVALVYSFKIRKEESKKVIKQGVKEILETTKFNVLRFAKLVMPGTENDENDVFIPQYCEVELWRKQSNCLAALQFEVDLDPLTLNDDDESEDESAEHHDN
ncbi:hypothetical protein M3Y98_00298600 [Aphelenchoides besseyi]|nr:hypothetical protein M3Y98_00298600 [Aphelenchoides besseyi]